MKKGRTKKQNAACDFSQNCVQGMIVAKVPIAPIEARVGDIEKVLLHNTKKFESINYIYIVDKNNKLKGVVSIKELLHQPKNILVSKIMTRKIIFISPHTHIKRAVYLAVKHSIKSVPVVDKDNVFLGIVPNDEILSTAYKETRESLLQFAGFHQPKAIVDNIFKLSLWQSFKHRFPWLFIGLLGGIAAAKIIGIFENTLEENLILAAFLPLMVYMSGTMLTQMQAFIIRDLVMNPKFKFVKYFFRQLSIVFLIGVTMSISLYIISFLMYRNLTIGFILSVALFTAIMSSVFVGLIFPYVISKMKFDPANASGPIAAIIQDITSIVVYFGVATWLL
ncbi:MAG: magnesium transporter [Parcubacteria group bacterium]|nr:magnesium transporter [Parcubacteria group bacterium]